MSSFSPWRSPGSALRGDKTPLKDQTHEQLEERVIELVKQLKDTQGRLTRSHIDIDRLVKELKVYNKRHEEDKKKIQDLCGEKKENGMLRAQLKELERAVSIEHLEYLKQLAACQTLEQKLDQRDKQLEELPRLRRALAETNDANDEQAKQFAATEQQLQDVREQLALLQQEVTSSQPLLTAAQQQAAALQQQYDELDERHKQLLEEHTAAGSLAERQANELTALKQQLAESQADLQKEKDAASNAQQQLESVQAQLLSKDSELDSVTAELQQARSEVQSLQSELQKSQTDKDAALLDQQKLQAEIEQQRQEAEQLLRVRIPELLDDNAAAAAKVQQLEQQLCEKEDEMATVKDQLEAAKAAAATDLAELKQQLQDEQAELAAVKERLAAAEASSAADVLELQQQLQDKDAELASTSNRLAAAETTAAAEVSELKQQLQSAQSELAAVKEQLATAQTVACAVPDLQQQLLDKQAAAAVSQEQLALLKAVAVDEVKQLRLTLQDTRDELAAVKDKMAAATAAAAAAAVAAPAESAPKGVADALKAADARNKVASKQFDLAVQQEVEAVLQERTQELTEQVSQLTQELAAAQDLLADALSRSDAFERDAGDAASHLLSLQQQIAALQEKEVLLAEAHAGQKQLQDEVNELQAENATLVDDKEQLLDTIAKIQSQLKETKHSAEEAQKLASQCVAENAIAKDEHRMLQSLMSTQRQDLREAHRNVLRVREQLQPLPQLLSTLAADIAAQQSGLLAVDIEVGRLTSMLRGVSEENRSGQQETDRQLFEYAASISADLKVTLEKATDQGKVVKAQAEDIVDSLSGCGEPLREATRVLSTYSRENSANARFSPEPAVSQLSASQLVQHLQQLLPPHEEDEEVASTAAGDSELKDDRSPQQQQQLSAAGSAVAPKKVSFVSPQRTGLATPATAAAGDDVDEQQQEFYTCMPDRTAARTHTAAAGGDEAAADSSAEEQADHDSSSSSSGVHDMFAAMPQLRPWPAAPQGGITSPASSSCALPATPTSTPAHSLVAAHAHWPAVAAALAEQQQELAAAAAEQQQLVDAEAAVELLSRMADTALLYHDQQELEGVVTAAATAAAQALQLQGEDEYVDSESYEASAAGETGDAGLNMEGVQSPGQHQLQPQHSEVAESADEDARWSSASAAGGASTVAALNEDGAALNDYIEGASAVGSTAGSVKSFESGSLKHGEAASTAAAPRAQHAMADVAAAAAGGKLGGVLLGHTTHLPAVDDMPTPHFWRHPAVYSPAASRSQSSPALSSAADTPKLLAFDSPAASGVQSQSGRMGGAAADGGAAGSTSAAAMPSPALSSDAPQSPLPGSLSPGMIFLMSPVGMTPAPAGASHAAFGAERRQQQTGKWIFGSSDSSTAVAAAGDRSFSAPALDSPGSESLSGISFSHPSPQSGQRDGHDSSASSPVFSGGAAQSPVRIGSAFRAIGSGLGVPKLNLAGLSNKASQNKGGSSIGHPIELPPVPDNSSAAYDNSEGDSEVMQLPAQAREESVVGSFGMLGGSSVGEPFSLPPVPHTDRSASVAPDSARSEVSEVSQPLQQKQLPKDETPVDSPAAVRASIGGAASLELTAAATAAAAAPSRSASLTAQQQQQASAGNGDVSNATSAAAPSVGESMSVQQQEDSQAAETAAPGIRTTDPDAAAASPSLGDNIHNEQQQGAEQEQELSISGLVLPTSSTKGSPSSIVAAQSSLTPTSEPANTAAAAAVTSPTLHATAPSTASAGAATPTLLNMATPVHPLLQHVAAAPAADATPGPEAYYTAQPTAAWQEQQSGEPQPAGTTAAAEDSAVSGVTAAGAAPFGGFFAFARQQQQSDAATPAVEGTAAQQQQPYFSCLPDKTAARSDAEAAAAEHGVEGETTTEAATVAGTDALPAAIEGTGESTAAVDAEAQDEADGDADDAASEASAVVAQHAATVTAGTDGDAMQGQQQDDDPEWEQIDADAEQQQQLVPELASEGSVSSSTEAAAAAGPVDNGSRHTAEDVAAAMDDAGASSSSKAAESEVISKTAGGAVQVPSVRKPVIRQLADELEAEADSGAESDSDYFFSRKV